MNDSKCGKVGKGLMRCVRIAVSATAFSLLAMLSLCAFLRLCCSVIDSVALAQDDGERGLNSESVTLAEWRVFLVAANTYDVGVQKLLYSENDVRELKAIFEALGVKPEHIVILTTENEEYSLKPYKEPIDEKYKEFLSGLSENSIAFVFLSGHGENDETHSYYWPADYKKEKSKEKRLSIDDMARSLDASNARFKWMCVDACRDTLDKGIDEGMEEKSLSINEAPRGVFLMQSCKRGEYSYEAGREEGAPYDNGIFTRALVDAINGRDPTADADSDGFVTVQELCDYVVARVPKDARRYCNASQHPIVTSFDTEELKSFADYRLFTDREWRDVFRLREEAEALEEEERYEEALAKIKEARRRSPKVEKIQEIEERIQALFDENDGKQKAKRSYQKAKEAFDAKNYQEAFGFIDAALELDPENSSYEAFKKLLPPGLEKCVEITANMPEPKPGTLGIVKIGAIDVRFRWCPAGRFMMGSPKDETGRQTNESQHEVTLTRGFWIAEIETTQALWKSVMKDNPSSLQDDNYPVNRVSWNNCQKFIGEIQRFSPEGFKFKLPSEAHWEYACRADTTTCYSFGDSWEAVTPDYANKWGVKGAHCSYWEWCEDWHAKYSAKKTRDPEGPKRGALRVVRGGDGSRSASRRGKAPNYRYDDIGFRLELVKVDKK